MPVPVEQWEWFGNAGHFCGSRRCRFHMTTRVGPWLVSTVGEYYPDDRVVAFPGEDIGSGRKYETMVFRIEGKCACGCCLPMHDANDLDGRGYNDAAAARAGHMELCREWAAKPGAELVGVEDITINGIRYQLTQWKE